MEFKRVLWNVRFICIIILLIGFLFVDFYNDVSEKVEEERIIEEMNAQFPQDIVEDVDYNAQYHEELDRIFKRVDNLYEDADTVFEKSKLDKTREDFQKLTSVTISECNEDTLENVTGNLMAPLLLVFVGIVLVSTFFEERKRGLWGMVHSTVRGRFSLAMRRAGIICVTMGLLTGIVYGGLFLINWRLEGMPDFAMSIQSYSAYEQLVKNINVQEFLIYYMILKIISTIAITMLVWLIISLVGNVGVGILISVAVLVIEFLMYKFIDPNAAGAIFRDINIFYFVDAGDWLEYYSLYGAGSFVVERRHILEFLAILIFVGGGIGTVLINAYCKPYTYSGIYQRIVEKESVAKLIAKLPVWLTEYRKMLCWSGGIVALLVVFLWVDSRFELTEEPYKEYKSQLKGYYEACEGKSLEWVDLYIEDLQEEMDSLENDDPRRNIMSNNIDTLSARLAYVREQVDKGRDVRMLDDTSYSIYYGYSSTLNRSINMIVTIVAMIIIFSNIYSFENRSNTIKCFYATKAGKVKLRRDKAIFIAVITLLIYFVIFGSQMYMHWYDYGFPFLDLSVFNATSLENVKIDCSMRMYLVFTELARLVLLLCIGFCISFISKYQTSEKTIIISVLVFVLPILISVVEKM